MLKNSTVQESKEQIFAHDRAWNLPGLFANRIDERKELTEELSRSLKDNSPCLLTISELLGSGKSFLLDMILAEFGIYEKMILTIQDLGKCENKSQAENLLKSYLDKLQTVISENQENTRTPFIIVDEVDIKYPQYPNMSKGVGYLSDFLKEKPIPLILSGDYILQNEQLVGLLPITPKRIKLKELDRKFFDEAIQKRVVKFTNEEYSADSFLTPDLSETLFPLTRQKISTFRETLKYLSEMVEYLPYNNEECIISGKEAKQWISDRVGPPMFLKGQANQKVFYEWLVNLLNDKYPRGKGMQPMSTLNFLDACEFNEKLNELDFEDNVLIPLAQVNWLISLGKPYFDERRKRFIRYPPPYLPSILTLLRAEYKEELPCRIT
jgi:hypothetical protein